MVSGTPAENYKDALLQIIKRMVVEGKPINGRSIEVTIEKHNVQNPQQKVLSKDELPAGEFYYFVQAAVWKGVLEGELKLVV